MDLLIHVNHQSSSIADDDYHHRSFLVRYLYPDRRDAYTYWAYFRNARQRNIGWRLDYFILSSPLQQSICDVLIQNGVYGSDHCPIVLFLNV